MDELITIQQKLNAPKSRRNSFGGYNYRSAEDILEAVKPLLKETDCALLLSDEVGMVGDWHYITATATLINKDGNTIRAKASARESAEKKGMDAAQITGTASSYARKYALNGLFAIDDNKDPDTDEYVKQTESTKAWETTKPSAEEECCNLIDKAKTKAEVTAIYKQYATDIGENESIKKLAVAKYNNLEK